MTPAQLSALKPFQPVVIVRDDLHFRVRRYIRGWRVRGIKMGIITVTRGPLNSDNPPLREFTLATGLGAKQGVKSHWLMAHDDLAAMTEIQPKPYYTAAFIEAELRACRRWPAWDSYQQDQVIRWCDFLLDDISDTPPNHRWWVQGEKERLLRAMSRTQKIIDREDKEQLP